MNKLAQNYTNNIKLINRNRINKMVLSLFLFVAVGVFVMKMIDGILLDYGFNIDKMMHDNYQIGLKTNYKFTSDWTDISKIHAFHRNFWSDPDVVYMSKLTVNPLSGISPGDKGNEWAVPALHNVVSRHPNTFWLLTQFTWLTTIIVILFVTFRLFKYESTIPSWLKWIMSQRTLSLVAMYDAIVGVGFWAAMFNSFQRSFIPGLEAVEFIITIIVHGVIPFAILCYSLIYLIKDKKASILKEMFVLKGIMFPSIYVLYYVMIGSIWNDPYNISNIRYNFYGHIWKLPLVLLVLWISLGFMLLIHNFILLKFNKKYDIRNDYEVIRRRDIKIEKLRIKTTRKVEKQMRK